jgi:hypothetical protein
MSWHPFCTMASDHPHDLDSPHSLPPFIRCASKCWAHSLCLAPAVQPGCILSFATHMIVDMIDVYVRVT